MIKIIFSDMDGTLLTSDKRLPPNFEEIISELGKRGIIFAPTSGRQYFSLLTCFEKFADDLLFISDGGALIMRGGKEIFSSTMKLEDAQSVLKTAENFSDVLSIFCGKKSAYILKNFNTPRYTVGMNYYYNKNSVVESWSDIEDEPIKIALYDPSENARENIYNKLGKFYTTLQVAQTATGWVDVMPQGINKGVAVRKLQQILNIKPDECMAFGDFLNDIEMLQAVEYSFAVDNAHDDVKKIAKYRTLANDDFGVVVAIKKFLEASE